MQGNPAALLNLGAAYEDGDVVAVDNKEAFRCYETAAAQGYAIAQYNLALLYASTFSSFCFKKNNPSPNNHSHVLQQYQKAGRGIERNTAKARELYELATKMDHAPAQTNLGKNIFSRN